MHLQHVSVCTHTLRPGRLMSHVSCPIHLHLNLTRQVGLYSQELLQKFSWVPRCMSPKTCKVMAGHRVGARAAMAVDKFAASA